jgi:hypothetical protein
MGAEWRAEGAIGTTPFDLGPTVWVGNPTIVLFCFLKGVLACSKGEAGAHRVCLGAPRDGALSGAHRLWST